MFRVLTVSLVLWLALTQTAHSQQGRPGREPENLELFKRGFRYQLEAEGKRHGCDGNLANLDETLWYCYGRICTYEVLDGQLFLDVEYDERIETLSIRLFDTNFNELESPESETHFTLPVTFDFTFDGTDYRVTVSELGAAPDSESYAMSACVDLSPIYTQKFG